MKYIDIHCHLDSADYKEDFDEVLGRMKESEVGAISIGTDLESSREAVRIAEEADKTGNQIWACIGVHPVLEPAKEREVDRGDFDEREFEELVKSPKVVAIGECGLDFFVHTKNGELSTISDEEKERQKRVFIKQIEFALKHDKALMLHCRPARTTDTLQSGRNAYSETLDILESYKKEFGDKLRGNSHFFAGNIKDAKRFLDIGFTMSYTGVVTFTHDYDEVIKYIGVESLISETDAPFVSPVPYRGKRNEPSFVIETVKRLAELKGLRTEEMSMQIIDNAKRLFSL